MTDTKLFISEDLPDLKATIDVAQKMLDQIKVIMKNKLNQVLILFVLTLLIISCENDSKAVATLNPTDEIEGLPPDPGEEGKWTLEGIDSDNDGIRDDIQRYIAIKYKNSEKTRLVLREETKAQQEFMLNAYDKEKVLEAEKKRSKANSCLFYIYPNNAYSISEKLKSEILNTEERIKAYYKADSHLGGMVFRLPKDEKSQCSFDPDKLKD